MSGEGKAVGRELANLAITMSDAGEELIELGFEDLGEKTMAVAEELFEHAIAMFKSAREED